MSLVDLLWYCLGVFAVAGLWVAALRRPDRLSDDALRLLGQREERQRGSYADRERLNRG